ncbi:chromosomal protein,like chromosomal protein xcap-e [Reticulomyxa filosa]|uniref:Chromosomal protein,like chromosomal protein xcap-e n=1 Tax=Reticulomyxa filosa TaxID=46433 RepID=X6NK97_RETFI|nr:chromosomal protein,like chromosomal protein xcap-e [Reticulomyxa filosa]|eukprot:ETO26745.1 chromosomal protein,like chromosomal protein xcap-e [Reticulomyxa filosa]
MWIKQIVMDGFKSYATRTVIPGWDPHFNAITGLNGSGKSNILDAICFVLGIQTLSQVRVQNLQQLVYKEGQARVTKASVSLIFDNTNKEQSPIGYEEYSEITGHLYSMIKKRHMDLFKFVFRVTIYLFCFCFSFFISGLVLSFLHQKQNEKTLTQQKKTVTRQVVIGGHNKYMINGQTATYGRVKDLFHSVQLDVNNPHFLIMQGRITKVLNMKPVEILGMIQEAAGTKMYEVKKADALKTMEKKQVKVDEINNILETEITPQLEKLRHEKSHYIKWTENNSEIERLDRLIIAHKFMCDSENVEKFAQELQRKEEQVEEMKSSHEHSKEEIERLTKELSIKEEDRIQQENVKYRHLMEQLNDTNKQLKIFEQQFKNENDNLVRVTKEIKNLENNVIKQEKLINDKLFEDKEHEQKFGSIQQKHNYLQVYPKKK